MEILLKTFLIILVIASMIVLSIKYQGKNSRGDEQFSWRPAGTIFGMLLLFGVIVLVSAFGTVSAGTRGVVLRFGAVTERTMGEGLYFIVPGVESVVMMDVQTQKYETPVAAASKDLQDVATIVALNYSLNPDRVNTVYQTLRKDYVERIISPSIQESVKAVTARYDAEDLITQRPKVKADIEESLRDRMARSGVVMEAVSITNFEFSESFTAAIEAKQVAAQRALEAENRLRQIEVEARQREAQAVGDKNAAIQAAEGRRQANILDAEGQAEAILKVATARSEANDLLSRTITNEIIRFTLAEKLPEGVTTIVIPAGQEFIFGEAVLGAVPK